MAVVKKTLPAKNAAPAAPAKRMAPPSGVTLATTMSEPSDSLDQYSILLFGAKKIGKTSLASMFPGAYFLSTEPGTKALSVYKTDIHDWRTFRAAVKAIRKDTRFQNTVVDTVDLAYTFCNKYVCDQLGIDHVSEADWGKGWAGVREEFEAVMRDLLAAPNKGTILISHATEKEIKRRDGSKYDRIQPTMANIAREICEAMVDIWAYYDYDGSRRVLTIRGDDHVTAGHRLQDRFQWQGREVVTIDMGTTKEQGFKNFFAAFNNAYAIPDAAPDDDATPAPVRKVVKKKVRG
jgi:hypothetical protein